MTLQNGEFGGAWAEAQLALREAFMEPQRAIRFAGWQMVLLIVIFGWILTFPPNDLAEGVRSGNIRVGQLFVEVLFAIALLLVAGILVYARVAVCWARWIVLGDDSVRFMDSRIGRREFLMTIYSIFLFLCALIIFAIKSRAMFLLIYYLALEAGGNALFIFLAAALFGGVLALIYLLARLCVALVPIATDDEVDFGRAWTATGQIGSRLFLAVLAVHGIEILADIPIGLFTWVTAPLSVPTLGIGALVDLVISLLFLNAKIVIIARAASQALYADRMDPPPRNPLPSDPIDQVPARDLRTKRLPG